MPKLKGSKIKKSMPFNQPPRNMTTVNADIKIMELYSPRKNKAKPILEYSTLYPDTSSLSASGKSNGALFVSAKILTKNIKKQGNSASMKYTELWNKIMFKKFKEPTDIKTAIRIKPIDTSYDIIWPALRIAPNKAYRELLAQPDKITP